jgi:hypothetical protein
MLRLVATPTNPGAMGGVEDEDDRTLSLVASGVADDDEPATGVEEALCFLPDPVPFLLAGVRNGLAGVEEEVVPVGGVATAVACLVTFPPAVFFFGGAVDVAELDEDWATTEVGLALVGVALALLLTAGGVALVAFLLTLTLLLTGGVDLALLLTGGVS